MKTILVATDFSYAARNAAHYAIDMAKDLCANIILLNVYQVPAVYADSPIAIRAFEIKADARKQLMMLKKDLLEQTVRTIPIDIEIKEGNFFEELKNVCKDKQPYITVIGTQGQSTVERFLFGSHASHVMQHLSYPVIAIPPNMVYSGIKRIGIACDFQRNCDVPTEEIKELVNSFHAELHVLNTCSEGTEINSLQQADMLQKKFGKAIPVFHFIMDDAVEEGLLDFVKKYRIDLLVVFPKHHSLINRLIYKSHTRELTLHSHVPILALHPSKVAAGHHA